MYFVLFVFILLCSYCEFGDGGGFLLKNFFNFGWFRLYFELIIIVLCKKNKMGNFVDCILLIKEKIKG